MNNVIIQGLSLVCNIGMLYYSIITQERMLLLVLVLLVVWNLFNLLCEIGEK